MKGFAPIKVCFQPNHDLRLTARLFSFDPKPKFVVSHKMTTASRPSRHLCAAVDFPNADKASEGPAWRR
jgi:hypothetical protein